MQNPFKNTLRDGDLTTPDEWSDRQMDALMDGRMDGRMTDG